MSYETEIEEVRRDFLAAEGKYDELRKIYDTVVEWEYATWDLHHFEPYYPERNKLPRGRRLKGENDPLCKVKHGLDRDGRCVLTVKSTSFSNQWYETFFVYGESDVHSYYFHIREKPHIIAVNDYTLAGGAVVKHSVWGEGGNSIAEYEYLDGRVAKETLRHSKRRNDLSEIEHRTILYEYDEKGLLSIKEDGYWYYRLSSKEFEELIVRAKGELVEAIGAALKENVRESVFKIAVLYEEGFCFPPDVMAGRVAGIAARFKGTGEEEYRLSPCEWGQSLRYGYDEALMQKLNNATILSAAKYRRLVGLIGDVAYELNRRAADLIDAANRTSDFIVVFSDFDGNDIRKNEVEMRKRLSGAT